MKLGLSIDLALAFDSDMFIKKINNKKQDWFWVPLWQFKPYCLATNKIFFNKITNMASVFIIEWWITNILLTDCHIGQHRVIYIAPSVYLTAKTSMCRNKSRFGHHKNGWSVAKKLYCHYFHYYYMNVVADRNAKF